MLVWSFQELEELNGETGFTECDDKLGAKLLKSGDVQDPRIGAHSLKPIGEKKTPVKRATRKRAVKNDTSKD